MNIRQLVIRNLIFYRRKNLTVILGIAIGAAVIAGALMVGKSVRKNLIDLAGLRLGNVSYTLSTGDRFITLPLAGKLENEIKTPVSPVLLLDGVAISNGGTKRVNKIQVLGVNNSFNNSAGTTDFFNDLSDEEIIINDKLANHLDVKPGEEILIRIKKASLIPMNAPFVSDNDLTVTARLTIRKIAHDAEGGKFNLRISQTAPFNAFVSIGMLNELMELKEKANILLFSGKPSVDENTIHEAIRGLWSPEDAGFIIRSLPEAGVNEILSERVFIDKPAIKSITAVPAPGTPVFTYFVNELTSASASTPYSFVSTFPDSLLNKNDIIINRWLADDLGVKTGDSIFMKYYTIGPLRKLTEDSSWFVVKEVVPIEGIYADKYLMPVIPGLTDADNCRDWETGIPIDLGKIRDKDEKYWDEFRGTPKAFISITSAVNLWENTYGSYTAVRFDTSSVSTDEIKNTLTTRLDPSDIGFTINNVADEGRSAATQGVDFSQLFAGLSFFVLVAAIILTVLLLYLNLESRREQVHTMRSLGIPARTVAIIMHGESIILAFAGALLGTLLGIIYTKIVFSALNGVWMDIVRTEMMKVHIGFQTLLAGFALTLLVSFLTLFFSVRRFIKKKEYVTGKSSRGSGKKRYLVLIALSGFLISAILLISQIIRRENINPAIFFAAGGLLLLSSLAMILYLLNRSEGRTFSRMDLFSLGVKNSLRNKSRSISIIMLLSLGTFIVLSTGANRKDVFSGAMEKAGGTGGFLYYAEATVPFLKDLNDEKVRNETGLIEDIHFVQFSVADGDDASCLNLNRISNPRIIGAPPEALEGRFSFISSTEYLDKLSPWSSLDTTIEGDIIPAIADETVIKWGMGRKAGDVIRYTNSSGDTIRLMLIGGLANSIFQGNVIISENNFRKNFPDKSGSGIFLIDGKTDKKEDIATELSTVFRDFGWEITPAAQRLAEFNSVENTYLSIFMVMGAFAILIGTAGMGVVLVRSILERKKEIALLKAIGFSSGKVLRLFLNEYLLLLLAGLLTGAVTSVIATLPSLINPDNDVSLKTVTGITAVLLVNGLFWIILLSAVNLRNPEISRALRNE